MTHSPLPSTLYTPQWTNRPNFASWNQARAFRFSGDGRYGASAPRSARAATAPAVAEIAERRVMVCFGMAQFYPGPRCLKVMDFKALIGDEEDRHIFRRGGPVFHPRPLGKPHKVS